MDVENTAEKDCTALGGLFQNIISDLKAGAPIWEDFLVRTAKLHSQLRCTVSASASFLEALQRIADMATQSQGATRDIGKALTRLAMRNKGVEARLKRFTASLVDCLVIPLQDKLEDWKKVTVQIDRDHTKEFKRARAEIKKKSTDTLRLKKKVRKASAAGPMQRSLDSALQDVSDQYVLLEEAEKQAVRRALIEQRRRYCAFVACIKPVVDHELCLVEEMGHLEEALESLSRLTTHPERLPSASEQVIADITSGSASAQYAFHTPPSSPSSLGSRKSSMCSISSCSMSSSGSNQVGHQHPHAANGHTICTSLHRNTAGGAHGLVRHRSFSQPAPAQASRLCSVSSQDSGFTSQDTIYAARLQRQGSAGDREAIMQQQHMLMQHRSELVPTGENPISPDECPYGFTPHTMSSTSVPWTNGDDLYGTLSRPRKNSAGPTVRDEPLYEARSQHVECPYGTRIHPNDNLYGTTRRNGGGIEEDVYGVRTLFAENPYGSMRRDGLHHHNQQHHHHQQQLMQADLEQPYGVCKGGGVEQQRHVMQNSVERNAESLYGQARREDLQHQHAQQHMIQNNIIRDDGDVENSYGTRSEMARPHTISSAYEKATSRPGLNSNTFAAPEGCSDGQRRVICAQQSESTGVENAAMIKYVGSPNPVAGPPALPKRNSFSAYNDVSPPEQQCKQEPLQQQQQTDPLEAPSNHHGSCNTLYQPLYANSADEEGVNQTHNVDGDIGQANFFTLQKYRTYAGAGSRASIAGGASTLPPRRKPPPPPVRRTPPSSTLSLALQQHKLKQQQQQQELNQQQKPRLPPSSLALPNQQQQQQGSGSQNSTLPAPPAELLSPSHSSKQQTATDQHQNNNVNTNQVTSQEPTAKHVVVADTDKLPTEGRVQALQSIYETRAQIQQAREAFYSSISTPSQTNHRQSDADICSSRDNLNDSRGSSRDNLNEPRVSSREFSYEIRHATQRSIENLYDRQQHNMSQSAYEFRSKSRESLDTSRENVYTSQSCSRDTSRENLYEALPADKNQRSPPFGNNKPPTPPRKPVLQRAHTFGEHDSAIVQSLANMFNATHLQRKHSVYEERRASLYSPPGGDGDERKRNTSATTTQPPQHSGVTAVKATFESSSCSSSGTSSPSAGGAIASQQQQQQLSRTSSGSSVYTASGTPPPSATAGAQLITLSVIQQPVSVAPPTVPFLGTPLNVKATRSGSAGSSTGASGSGRNASPHSTNNSPSPRSSVIMGTAAAASAATDDNKRRFLQQLNAKLAETTTTTPQQQQFPATTASSSPVSVSSGTSFFGRSSSSRRSVSETRGSTSRLSGSGVTDAAQRVHAWLSSRSPALDIHKCRETLMDQIRRGKSLKRQQQQQQLQQQQQQQHHRSNHHHHHHHNNHHVLINQQREILHPHHYSGATATSSSSSSGSQPTTIEQAVGGHTNATLHNNHHYH